MKPFILQGVEFDSKRMVVIACTDQGVYEIPVLPAPEHQCERYVIRFKNGRYVIMTKDFERLKNGAYTVIDVIRLAHEVTHLDGRVICPAYSLGKIIFEKLVDAESMKNAEKLGLSVVFRLENFLEDVLSKKLLIEIGFNREDVERAIPTDKRFNNIVKTWWTILKEIRNNLFGNMKPVEFPFEHLQRISFKTFEERIRFLFELYTSFDIFLILTMYRIGADINPKKSLTIIELNRWLSKQKEFVRRRIEEEEDPLWKLRWELEMERVDRRFQLWFKVFKRFLPLYFRAILKQLRLIK